MTLKPEQQLYVRSMGRLLRVTAFTFSTAEANRYMETHPEAALVAEFGALKLIADRNDLGKRFWDDARPSGPTA